MIPVSLFYIFAIIPFLLGGYFWYRGKQVVIVEWLIGSAVGFILAGIFHFFAIRGQTDDKEVWSGQITYAKQFSAWTEYYEEAIYRTEYKNVRSYVAGTKGRDGHYATTRVAYQVFSYWAPRQRDHKAKWEMYSNIDTSYIISLIKYQDISRKFGQTKPIKGDRTTSAHDSKMIGGDPNDYITVNGDSWVEPITKNVHFANRMKATPSVFSFPSVPEKMAVFPYPYCPDEFSSNRLLGNANTFISALAFDQFNAVVGPQKKVNVIMVGMSASTASSFGKWQEAAWIGGKKNDIVIVYASDNGKNIEWVTTFGWTNSKTVLRMIESSVMENGINNKLLPIIQQDIIKYYQLKDFTKEFAHLAISARPIHLIWYLIVVSVVQFGLWYYFHNNEFKKTK